MGRVWNLKTKVIPSLILTEIFPSVHETYLITGLRYLGISQDILESTVHGRMTSHSGVYVGKQTDILRAQIELDSGRSIFCEKQHKGVDCINDIETYQATPVLPISTFQTNSPPSISALTTTYVFTEGKNTFIANQLYSVFHIKCGKCINAAYIFSWNP